MPPTVIDCAKVTFLNPTNAPWSQGGGGGVTPSQAATIADNEITNHVTSGYLCTSNAAATLSNAAETRAVAKAAAMTNAITFAQLKSKPNTLAGYGITDAYTQAEADNEFISKTKTDLQSIQSEFLAPSFYGTGSCQFRYIDNERGINIGTDGYVTAYKWENFRVNYGSESDYEYLPDWLDENYLYTDADAINAGRTNGFITAATATNIAEAVASSQFTTNNAALVSVVTNLAPSKARGISLADPVRHCNWYQCVTNGVFFWLVEE